MMDDLAVRGHPSPNFGPRRGVAAPDMIVVHYTGMESAAAAIDRLADPMAEVSAHDVIDLDGSRIKMVRPRFRAWHAGVSRWGGLEDVNSHALGVELVNPGTHPFPEAQMVRLEALLSHWMTRFAIPPERVVGHACVAPGRKIDPGPRFDWRRLAQGGLAIWRDPDPAEWRAGQPSAEKFQDAARRFGYGIARTGLWDAQTRAVWQAFRSRFLPGRDGAEPEPGDVSHLAALARMWPCRGDV